MEIDFLDYLIPAKPFHWKSVIESLKNNFGLIHAFSLERVSLHPRSHQPLRVGCLSKVDQLLHMPVKVFNLDEVPNRFAIDTI